MEPNPLPGSVAGDIVDRSRMWVEVSKAGTLYRKTERKRANFISREFLAVAAPWLTPGTRTPLKVTYPGGRAVYTCYRGGPIWIVRVPRDIAQPGESFEIMVERLTRTEFVLGLCGMEMTYKKLVRWMSRTSSMSSFRLRDDFLSFDVRQSSNFEGVSSFAVDAVAARQLQFNAGMTWLDLQVRDAFANFRLLRLAHDGRGNQMLCLKAGRHFARVHLASSDGYRLNLA